MSFKIVSDTTCNVPMRLLESEDVRLIPFTFYPKDHSENEEYCIDIDTFDGTKYYNTIREGNLYNTSQINPQRFYDVIAPLAEEGNDVLYVSMSSGISGAFNSALVAKKMLEEDFPDRKFFMLDTRAASLAEAISIFKAIELRKQGVSIEECYNTLVKLADSVYQVFTVDSLTHLQRTGRLSNAAAIIGNVLNLKPLLKGNEKGQIINFAKVRGTKKAIQAMADKYNELVKNPSEQTVYIAHTDAPEYADLLTELLKKDNPPKEVLSVMYEPVTGSHVGPGAIALFFVGEDGVRFK